jgi:uncharacterized protein (DUF2267 family)
MAMDKERFLEIVQGAADIDRETAERATRATLETLAERIAEGEARDLAMQVPAEIAPYLGAKGPAQGFDSSEFVRRVAEREGVDLETAYVHARAVFAALGQAVSADELADVQAELSTDYERLMPRWSAESPSRA